MEDFNNWDKFRLFFYMGLMLVVYITAYKGYDSLSIFLWLGTYVLSLLGDYSIVCNSRKAVSFNVLVLKSFCIHLFYTFMLLVVTLLIWSWVG